MQVIFFTYHKKCSAPSGNRFKHGKRACSTSPTLIGVEKILIMVTNFFWLLLVFRDDCKKQKKSENMESGGPARPKNNVPPL